MKKLLVAALTLVFLFAACSAPVENDVPEIGAVVDEPTGPWYENEFTRLLPEMDGMVGSVTEINNTCSMYVVADEANAVAYIAKVKESGIWDKTVRKDTETAYAAENSKGYEIDISYVQGSLVINITRL